MGFAGARRMSRAAVSRALSMLVAGPGTFCKCSQPPPAAVRQRSSASHFWRHHSETVLEMDARAPFPRLQSRRRTHKRNSQGPSRWSGSPQIAAAARPGRASNSHHPKMTNHTAIADVPGDCFSRAASACLCFSASPRSQSRNAMSAGSSWRIGRYSKNQFSRLLAMIGNGATNRPAASASLTYGS